MALAGRPTPFIGIGTTDSVDGTLTQGGEGSVFGNLQAAINLIPDPSTRALWMCRPAAVQAAGFTGFSSPGVVTVQTQIGRYLYGMIPSALNAGKDQPFCYDVIADAMVTVTGITGANTPTSPASTGAWSPPNMELVGVNLVVQHAGFDGVTNFFGWFDISNPAAPVWHAGNVTVSGTGIDLDVVPTWVSNFYGRAYFLCNPPGGQPAAFFTDPLTLNISDAAHILTFDDTVPLTCAAGLSLHTQLGGIVQALIVFKGITNMHQVTGDAALTDNPLSQNSMNVATGTLAPNSICNTPKGLAFMAPDGVRYVNFDATVSDPIGAFGAGISIPMIYASVPSRVAAAYSSNVLRISVQNGYIAAAPWQEYWFHLSLGVWSGPHNFPAAMITPYQNGFIMAGVGIAGKLWRSEATQSSTSVFVENGVQMAWDYKTVMLPDQGEMAEMEWVETTIDVQLAAGIPPIVFVGKDQNNSIIGSAIISVSNDVPIWGAFIWGLAVWGGAAYGLAARQIRWPQPITYKRICFELAGESRLAIRVGKMFTRANSLGYLIAPYESA